MTAGGRRISDGHGKGVSLVMYEEMKEKLGFSEPVLWFYIKILSRACNHEVSNTSFLCVVFYSCVYVCHFEFFD